MYKKASCSLIVCKVNKNYNKKQTILNKYWTQLSKMGKLKKLKKLEKLKPYALQLNIHSLKAVGHNFFNFSTMITF